MKTESLFSRRALAAAAAAAICALAPVTQAQELCYPTPIAVPGNFFGPPRWTSGMTSNTGVVVNSLNEPRWGAFDPQRFFNDLGSGSTAVGQYRIIREGRYLYISFQATGDGVQHQSTSATDPKQDFISFGIFNESQTIGRIVYIPLNKGNVGNTDPAADPNPALAIESWHYNNTTSVWDKVPNVQDWVVPGSIGSFTRQPVTVGGADWAIQFAVDLQPLGLDLASDAAERVKIAMIMRPYLENGGDRQPVLSVPRRPGGVTIEPVGESLVPLDRTLWQDTTMGTACLSGLEFESVTDIGTIPPGGLTLENPELSSKIDTVNTRRNTFSARPNWNGVAFAGTQAGRVTARFRIADWGAQVPGLDPYKLVPTLDKVNHDPMTGFFEQQCPANADGKVCGGATTGLTPTDASQCMIVELSSTAGVPIKTPIIYRNMRFEPLSEKTLKATISAKGMKALNKQVGEQRVLLDIITRNMPAAGNWPMFLDSSFLNYIKLITFGVLNAINPFGRSLTLDQQMKVVWPTYEAHTYYWTGRTYKYKGSTFKEMSPMNSFGYFHSHSGIFYGYSHTLMAGPTRLKPNAETYELRVPEEGTATITTRVRTQDIPTIVEGLLGTVTEIACAVFPGCAR